MAIDVATGFNIGSKDAIDERQVLTLEQMKNLDESIYPDKYFAICKDNGKLYIFNASNEINAETGKFRVLSGGTGGGDTTYVLPPATDTTLGGVKVDNVTITVDSEGVITAINSYEEQIKDWVSGGSYLEGDYIYHEGEIYRCLTSNSDVDFDESNWEQVTYGIDELSKEDVERLLGLTEEEIEAMADLILDTEVRIDKTYSSSKIYTDIQQCLEDSKTYTLEELEKVKIDDTLTTTDKTIVGAINEVKDSIITNYEDLTNKPSIAGVELDGNKSLSDLGITIYDDTEVKSDIASLNEYKQNKKDNTLTTTDKTVTGAINEVKLSIPTKVSDLTNDKNYISSIPSEYVTETELNAKGYLTSHQDISGLQTDISNINTSLDNKVDKTALKDIQASGVKISKSDGTKKSLQGMYEDGELGGGVEIDDSKSSSDTTYSSTKIVELTSKYAMSFNSSIGKLSITLK